mmetsp:Transcript_5529/g.14649  ORF Transcript_5529/g.14649 Transcript_5529/m.14649 type:complete len:221 (+) Transcript_5529:960-1622(+)
MPRSLSAGCPPPALGQTPPRPPQRRTGRSSSAVWLPPPRMPRPHAPPLPRRPRPQRLASLLPPRRRRLHRWSRTSRRGWRPANSGSRISSAVWPTPRRRPRQPAPPRRPRPRPMPPPPPLSRRRQSRPLRRRIGGSRSSRLSSLQSGRRQRPPRFPQRRTVRSSSAAWPPRPRKQRPRLLRPPLRPPQLRRRSSRRRPGPPAPASPPRAAATKPPTASRR